MGSIDADLEVRAPLEYPAGMTAPSKPVPQKDERSERLAAALRENLKRRKAQIRSKGARAQGEGRTPGKSGEHE
jgi:hypothetical protein